MGVDINISLGSVFEDFGKKLATVAVFQNEDSFGCRSYVVGVPSDQFRQASLSLAPAPSHSLWNYQNFLMNEMKKDPDIILMDLYHDDVVVTDTLALGLRDKEDKTIIKQVTVGHGVKNNDAKHYKITAQILSGVFGKRDVHIGLWSSDYTERFIMSKDLENFELPSQPSTQGYISVLNASAKLALELDRA